MFPPLRWRAAVVSKVRFWRRGVGLVFIQVSRHVIAWPVEFGAGSFMVAGQDHVRDLGSDTIDPLLPQVPIGFV